MKERPILFNGPMVRAILAGTKTQTRRVVKPQPPQGTQRAMYNVSHYAPDEGWFFVSMGGRANYPYSQPGDRLWVRETWRDCGPTKCAVTGSLMVRYRADGAWSCGYEPQSRTPGGPWCPSIHMPRWASRITLEVTDVRVERVQDITEDDARAEGVDLNGIGLSEQYTHTAVSRFEALWNSINAERGYPWFDVDLPDNLKTGEGRVMHGNPWVWVVEFRRLEAQ